MNLHRHALSSLVWTLTESAGLSLLSLITLFVLARLVSTEEFGVAALALSIVQLLNMLAENLFQDAVVQRRELSERDLATAFWAALGCGAFVSAACAMGAPYLAAAMDKPLLAPVLAWMSISLVANASAAVIVARLRRDLKFRSVAIRSLSARLAGSVAGIGLAIGGYGVWGLVAQQAAASVIGAGVIWLGGHYRPKFLWSGKTFWELAKFSGPQSVSNFFFVGSARIASILVGTFLGASALGLLSIATRISDAVRDLLVQAVNPLSLPLFSQKQDDPAALTQRYAMATGFACLVTFPVFVGLIVAAPELFHLALGEKWLPAIPLFQLLMVGLIIQFSRLFSITMLNAVGKPGASAALAMVDFAAMSVLILGIGRHDVLLAAAAIAGRQLIVTPVGLMLVRRLVAVGIWTQLRPAVGPACAALLAGLAAAWLRQDYFTTQPAFVSLLLTAAVIIVVYLPAVALIDRPLLPSLGKFLAKGLRSQTVP